MTLVRQLETMGLSEILKDDNFIKEENGIIFYIDVVEDIKSSKDVIPTDKNNWSYWRKENYSFLKKELNDFSDDKVIIDLGAGQSDFQELFERFEKYSVDFYPYKGIDVVCDLTKDLPFKDSSVDILIMSNLLEHISEPNNLLNECSRILKGVILGTVPFLIDIHQRPYDFYRYTDINLKYLLKKHNFRNVNVKPVLMLYILLYNTTTNFFVNLIQKTEFSKNKYIQKLHTYFLRALWKMIRIGFYILSPLFQKCHNDINVPLGYLFKAEIKHG